MTDRIDIAAGPGDYEAFAQLVIGYVEWCRLRYADLDWFVDEVFGHQCLADELASLSACYGPPRGKTLLARSDGRVSGAAAYRQLPDGSCEMKRLFVSARFNKRGLGRKLCETLIATARTDGFDMMRLDTGDRFTEALAMYESLGFRTCRPHHQYPAHLMPHLVFMELPLAPAD